MTESFNLGERDFLIVTIRKSYQLRHGALERFNLGERDFLIVTIEFAKNLGESAAFQSRRARFSYCDRICRICPLWA